jgi:hypothetical protein
VFFLLLVAGGVFLTAIIPGSPLVRGISPGDMFFLRIGAGSLLAQYMVIHALTPVLGQTLLTTVSINVGIGLSAAVGSLATSRMGASRATALILATGMAAALAVSPSLLSALRLSGENMDIPWPALFIATAPLGLSLGLFFPLGLKWVGPGGVATALIADAAGAIGGYALYCIFLIQFGARAIPWLCAAIYVCAGLGLTGSPAGSRSPEEDRIRQSAM